MSKVGLKDFFLILTTIHDNILGHCIDIASEDLHFCLFACDLGSLEQITVSILKPLREVLFYFSLNLIAELFCFFLLGEEVSPRILYTFKLSCIF